PRHLPNPEYRPTRSEIRGFLSHSGGRSWAISDPDRVFSVSSGSPRTGPAREFSGPAVASPSARKAEPLDSSGGWVRCIRCTGLRSSVSVLRESDNDANCPPSDCRGSVGPVGLHKPI